MCSCPRLTRAPHSRRSALATKRVRAARLFSAQPATLWREAVADKTAALDARMKGSDERIASVQKAMEVNKEAIDKAMGATEKGVMDAVGGIKTDVEKAVGGIKTDVEKAVGGIKTDVEKALKMEMIALKAEMNAMEKIVTGNVTNMEKIVTGNVTNMKDSLKMLERLVFAAMTVFIFGKQIGSGISEVFEAATTRAGDRAGVKG